MNAHGAFAQRLDTEAPLSADDVLQHRLVEREVGDDLLQPPVLLLELPQPPDLGHAHVAEPLLPAIERLLTDAELAAELDHGRAGLRLPQREADLLLRVTLPGHRLPSPASKEHARKTRIAGGSGFGEGTTISSQLGSMASGAGGR
jgi:hypothetical protein